MSESLERFLIGEVGVDSGQLMICDPAYIDGEWRRKELDLPRIHVNGAGTTLQHGVDFKHYEEPIARYGGMTMNQLNNTGEWEQAPYPNTGTFDYQGACEATLSDEGAGQLNYRMGHAGAGVAFSSGYGDGSYQVWGYRNSEGRIMRVSIEMENHEEDENELL